MYPKFRVWDKRNKKWIKDESIYINQDGQLCKLQAACYDGETWLDEEDIDNVEVNFFTGIYGKDSNEIYEGDIVFAELGEVYNGLLISHIEEFGVIKFIDGMFDLNSYPIGIFDLIEIKGNIHENPELLQNKN